MASIRFTFARLDSLELRLCRRLNRCVSMSTVRRLFAIASRLGDGPVWYLLMASMPLLRGERAVRPVLIMAATAAGGHLIYAALKRTFVRERPFVAHAEIAPAGAPLDRYSFPSGHTLHAVSFTWQAVAHFPETGWILVPLALLIGASRVVLGLHYPTDVVAGAALGSVLGAAAVTLA